MMSTVAARGRPRSQSVPAQRLPADAAGAPRPRPTGPLADAGPALALAGRVQSSLAVGGAGDRFEQEADMAAERVASGQPVQRLSRGAASGECPACAAERAKGGVQRKCAACAQREAGGSDHGARLDTAGAEGAMADAAGSGAPLSPELRGMMERRFGEDFGAVRVHHGAAAHRANRALDARAFTRGSDVYLRGDSSPDDRRLMAHELTHVVQQSPTDTTTARRQPAPPQKDVPPPAGPAADHVAELRAALGGRRKAEAFAAIKAMTRAEGERVLGDAGMRFLAVWTFETPEMVEALQLLPGSVVLKIEWLKTAGGSLDDAHAVIKSAPEQERPTLYARDDLRDWFIQIIGGSYGEIYMKDLVQRHIGGTLREKLGWIKAEGSTNFRWLMEVIHSAPPDQRAALLDDAEMRAFFAGTLGDHEMKWVVDTLGGPLSGQIEWIQAKGSDLAPEAATRTLPSLSPRDAELLDRMEGEGDPPTLYQDYLEAQIMLGAHRARGRGTDQLLPPDPIDAQQLGVLTQKYDAAGVRLDAALARAFPGVADTIFFDARELRIAAFLEQVRRFEALFVGFGLQTAFAMLADNQRVAMQESGRYSNPREADALLRLLSISLWGSTRAHVAINFSWKGADLSPFFSSGQLRTYPILTHPKFYNDTLVSIIDDYTPGRVTDEDISRIAAHVRDVCDSVIDNISETRSKLSGDTDKLWDLDGVLEQAKQGLGIVKGSPFDRLIEHKRAKRSSDSLFRTIGLMALIIVLTIVSAGTGAFAIPAAAALVAVSAAGAVQSYRNYAFTAAARGASLDPAQTLTQVEPSSFWLAVDIISVFIDLHGFVGAIKRVAEPALAVVKAGRLTAAGRGALEGRAEAVAAELKVGKDIVSRDAFVVSVIGSTERRAAEEAAIHADVPKTRQLREDLRALGKAGDALANDNGVVAGLLSLEEGMQQAVLRAFRHEPELISRLGMFAGPAGERAIGINLLRNGLGETGFENVMRDLLTRRDLARADALIRAIDKDVLTLDEMEPLAAAANKGDAAARAAAVDAEVDRLVTKSSRLPAPGSQAERDALNKTREMTTFKEPEKDLADELAYLQRRTPQPIDDPEYVAEVALPNGHTWKMNKYGRWCRFSGAEFCLTSEGINQLIGRVSRAEKVVETTAPLGAPIYRIDPRHPPDVVPPGVVLEFPTGERVFRAGDGGIVIESRLGRPGARKHFEAAYFSRGELQLDDYTRALMERAHAQGAGTGFESPFAILYAPRVVNQELQNTGIEQFLRELRAKAPADTEFHLVTNSKAYAASRRLSSIEYRIDVSTGGVRKRLFEVEISVSDSADPVMSISANAVDPPMVDILDAVDLPYTIRERLALIMQGRWRRGIRP
jgi:hypothetical protein